MRLNFVKPSEFNNHKIQFQGEGAWIRPSGCGEAVEQSCLTVSEPGEIRGGGEVIIRAADNCPCTQSIDTWGGAVRISAV